MVGSIDGKVGADAGVPGVKPTPAEMLKQAVTRPTAPVIVPHARMPLHVDLRSLAVAATALVIGTAVGVFAAPRDRSGEAATQIEAALDANHAETTRLAGEIEKTGRTLVALREAAEAARTDAAHGAAAAADRIGRLETTLVGKVAALGERIEGAERDHGARLTALTVQMEKRPTPPASPPTTPSPVAAVKPEPTQTGSIAEAKPTKPGTVEAWALRDVYDGVAVLEDRKRRLAEVAPGDTVPGVGRVEAIERRGRSWVVVTKQGLITPQTW